MNHQNKRSKPTWSRRDFFGAGAGMFAGLAAGCAQRRPTTAEPASTARPTAAVARRYADNIYTRLLDVTPHLPAHDHITASGGSRMPSEVIEAMREANE